MRRLSETSWKDIPKVELHCHLDGSVDPDFMRNAACTADDEAFRDMISVPVNYSGNLSDYLKKFDLPIACLNSRENIRQAVVRLLKTAGDENVLYMEVRFSPLLLERDGLIAGDTIESAIEGLREAKEQYGIEAGLLLCAMRHHDERQNLRVVKLAREYMGEGVCGLDLAGDESRFSTSRFAGVFKKASEEKIPFTIHAGECKNPLEIKIAIEMGAARIGHGIAMKGCPELIKMCADRHIGVEMCPVSNYQTGALSRDEVYPVREFMDNKVMVTVNTDNRTVSSTTLTNEMMFLNENFRVTRDEILQLQRNAVICSFADDTIKDRLLKRMQG